MANSVGGRRVTPVRAIDLQETSDLAHLVTLEPHRRSRSHGPGSIRFNTAPISSCKNFAAAAAFPCSSTQRGPAAITRSQF
jgi:hypothetical protein